MSKVMRETHERVEEALLNAKTALMEFEDKLDKLEDSAFLQESCYRADWYRAKHHAAALVQMIDNYEDILNSVKWRWT